MNDGSAKLRVRWSVKNTVEPFPNTIGSFTAIASSERRAGCRDVPHVTMVNASIEIYHGVRVRPSSTRAFLNIMNAIEVAPSNPQHQRSGVESGERVPKLPSNNIVAIGINCNDVTKVSINT